MNFKVKYQPHSPISLPWEGTEPASFLNLLKKHVFTKFFLKLQAISLSRRHSKRSLCGAPYWCLIKYLPTDVKP